MNALAGACRTADRCAYPCFFQLCFIASSCRQLIHVSYQRVRRVNQQPVSRNLHPTNEDRESVFLTERKPVYTIKGVYDVETEIDTRCYVVKEIGRYLYTCTKISCGKLFYWIVDNESNLLLTQAIFTYSEWKI